jgi:hypothetical protein
MVCSIADNTPLRRLQLDLELPSQCHSLRPRCIQGYEARTGTYALGLPGTALGYCQALFNYAGDPESHTRKVARLLNEIQAPWSNSHELFWGHRQLESPSEFVEAAIKPLLGTGRVPVLITSLDPAHQMADIENILVTDPSIQSGETVLVRMVLNGQESVYKSAAVIRSLLAASREKAAMPKWWPLFQSEIGVRDWRTLKKLLKRDWKYVNIAVNPFTADGVLEFLRDQITVAQIPLGLAKDISSDATVRMSPGMKIMGATEGTSYSLARFMCKLRDLNSPPTIIILGPSLSHWSDEMNQGRLDRLLPILRSTCDTLWGDLSETRREGVWQMKA